MNRLRITQPFRPDAARLFWLETHQAVSKWVLGSPTGEGFIHGQTNAIDATTLEANAAMKSIVRRGTLARQS